MALTLQRPDLSAGRIICLHVPHGLHDEGQALEDMLLQFAQREGKSVAVCRAAMPYQGVFQWFRRQTSRQWLADAAGISLKESEKMIAEFGVPVAADMSANAATPRCLLGIAAMIVRQPHVLIYRTDGLDPRGWVAVHRYAATKGRDLCLAYLSTPIVFGDGSPAPRHCPPSADCIAMSGNS